MPLRRPEAPQQATFLELFFDLAFVLALAQLSHLLLDHLTWSGAAQTMVLLLAVWLNWTGTTWITDRLDQHWAPVQLLVMVSLLGSATLAAAVPEAFGKHGLIFAGVYVATQLGRITFVMVIMRGHELERTALRGLLWCGVSALPWIVGGFTHGITRGVLWTLAVAADYAGHTLAYRRPGGGRKPASAPPPAAEHMAERYRQVFIIALGELILLSGLALSASGFTLDKTAAFVVSIAATTLLWRIYIYRAGELLPAAFSEAESSTRVARWEVYVHLVMVAGVVVTTVGQVLVIEHPLGPTTPAWSVAIFGGPALFLAGRAGFEYTVFARVSWTRPIGILVLAALTPVMLVGSPLPAAIAVTAVLAGIAAADAARARGRPPERPSPPG
ncbi:low temperature requirement protein A [Micromonospora sp. WMMD558]|uniref:low temperature requirement protein A n=1 Tax=Micromonospora sp. WMMD558 TaxID=3403462 RepID=UPI003BF574EB